MKSGNAVAKVASKKYSRVGHLSLLTFMILSFIVGSSAFADDLKLWKIVPKGQTAPQVKLIDGGEKADAIKWLHGANINYAQFATTFGKKPIKFIQGFQAALVKAMEAGVDKDTFVTATEAGLNGTSESSFGERGDIKRGFLISLLKELAKRGKSDLVDADGNLKLSALKEILDKDNMDWILEGLGLTKNDPNKKKEEPVVGPGGGAGAGSGDGEETEEDDKLAQANERMAEMQRIIDGFMREQAKKPGEYDDAELDRLAQVFCNRMKANEMAKKDKDDGVKEAIEDLNKGFDDIADGMLALANKPKPQQEDSAKDGLADMLPELLKNAMKGEEEEEPMSPPPSPQSSGGGPSPSKKGGKNPFESPPPKPEEEEPQMPMQQPSQPPVYPPVKSDNDTPQINMSIPENQGKRTLEDTEDALDDLEGRQSVVGLVNQNTPADAMIRANTQLKGLYAEKMEDYKEAKSQLKSMNNNLDELQKGAEENLPKSVLRKERRLESKVKEIKEQIESNNQLLGNKQYDPTHVQGRAEHLNQKLRAAKKKLKDYREAKQAKIEEINPKIKRLARRRDDLQSVAKSLKGELKKLKTESEQLAGMIESKKSAEIAAILSQQQQQRPVTNAFKLNQAGGTAAQGPRAAGPSRTGMGGATGAQGLQGQTGNPNGRMPLR